MFRSVTETLVAAWSGADTASLTCAARLQPTRLNYQGSW